MRESQEFSDVGGQGNRSWEGIEKGETKETCLLWYKSCVQGGPVRACEEHTDVSKKRESAGFLPVSGQGEPKVRTLTYYNQPSKSHSTPSLYASPLLTCDPWGEEEVSEEAGGLAETGEAEGKASFCIKTEGLLNILNFRGFTFL